MGLGAEWSTERIGQRGVRRRHLGRRCRAAGCCLERAGHPERAAERVGGFAIDRGDQFTEARGLLVSECVNIGVDVCAIEVS
jgi:hypothetical protein